LRIRYGNTMIAYFKYDPAIFRPTEITTNAQNQKTNPIQHLQYEYDPRPSLRNFEKAVFTGKSQTHPSTEITQQLNRLRFPSDHSQKPLCLHFQKYRKLVLVVHEQSHWQMAKINLAVLNASKFRMT